MGDYLTSPREEEAYLAEIKRHYFQATGKHVRTPEEARKALEGGDTPQIEAFLASFIGNQSYSFTTVGRRVTRPQ